MFPMFNHLLSDDIDRVGGSLNAQVLWNKFKRTRVQQWSLFNSF